MLISVLHVYVYGYIFLDTMPKCQGKLGTMQMHKCQGTLSTIQSSKKSDNDTLVIMLLCGKFEKERHSIHYWLAIHF